MISLASSPESPVLTRKVLIVEDTEDTRELLRLILEMYGYDVTEATNGLEALERAKQERPSAILMDMSLPLMDGCQATRQIKAQPDLHDIPIIACTAHNRWEWRAKAMLAGCDDFITKPIDAQQLDILLTRHIEGQSH